MLRQTQSPLSRAYGLEEEEATTVKGAHGVSVHSGEGTRTTRAKDAAGLLRGREERGGDGRDRTGNANRGVAFAKCQVRQITLFRDGQVGCLPGTGSRGEA